MQRSTPVSPRSALAKPPSLNFKLSTTMPYLFTNTKPRLYQSNLGANSDTKIYSALPSNLTLRLTDTRIPVRAMSIIHGRGALKASMAKSSKSLYLHAGVLNARCQF